MALKDWNIGKRPADPPNSGWTPLKEFIHYGYGKLDSSARLPQDPRSTGANLKGAVDTLLKKTRPKKTA